MRKFFAGQNAKVRAEYARSVAALTAYGFLIAPMGEKVEPGLFAIRIRKGGNVRVFYVYAAGNYVYGLHAYEKKTREIPLHELALARQRMNEIGGHTR